MAASIVRWRLLIAVKRAGGIAEGEDIGNTPNIEILGTIVEQVNGMIDRVMEIPPACRCPGSHGQRVETQGGCKWRISRTSL